MKNRVLCMPVFSSTLEAPLHTVVSHSHTRGDTCSVLKNPEINRPRKSSLICEKAKPGADGRWLPACVISGFWRKNKRGSLGKGRVRST